MLDTGILLLARHMLEDCSDPADGDKADSGQEDEADSAVGYCAGIPIDDTGAADEMEWFAVAFWAD